MSSAVSGQRDALHVVHLEGADGYKPEYKPEPPRQEDPKMTQAHLYCNPGPLGLFAYGMTACSLMFVNMSWAGAKFTSAVIGFGFAYAGLTQWVAGVMEAIRGNTFGATVSMSYGAFWMSWWFTATMDQAGMFFSENEYHSGQALLMFQWGCFTLGIFGITLHRSFNNRVRAVFATLALTYFMMALGQFAYPIKVMAGYMGFISGMTANFAAFTELTREVWGDQERPQWWHKTRAAHETIISRLPISKLVSFLEHKIPASELEPVMAAPAPTATAASVAVSASGVTATEGLHPAPLAAPPAPAAPKADPLEDGLSAEDSRDLLGADAVQSDGSTGAKPAANKKTRRAGNGPNYASPDLEAGEGDKEDGEGAAPAAAKKSLFGKMFPASTGSS